MNHVTKNYWRSFMSEKIQVLGISVEKCYVDEVMDNINENWNRDDVLATYGVINMKILLAAQKDEELKEYIDSLDKGVVDEPEVLEAANLFWYLSRYQNQIYLLGETEEEANAFFNYVKEKYPEIVVLGKGSLKDGSEDDCDKIINDINALAPQAVLGCSGDFSIERFVKKHRKKMNTRVFFCLGERAEIQKETGVKKRWLEKILEKSSFKKLVSQFNEDEKN